MNAYLFTLILICAISGALLYLLKDSKFEKHVRYLCCLVLLAAAASPLKTILKSDPSALFQIPSSPGAEYSSGFSSLLLQKSEESLKAELTTLVCEKTGLSDDEIELIPTLRIEEANVVLEGTVCRLKSAGAVMNREKIRELLKQQGIDAQFEERFGG